MSEYETGRDYCVAVLNSVPGVVNVYDRVRWTVEPDEFRATFTEFLGPGVKDYRVHAWWVTQIGQSSERRGSYTDTTLNYLAEGVMAFSDGEVFEPEFLNEVESIRKEFDRHVQGMSGGPTNLPSTLQHSKPVRIEPIDMVDFGPVKCHHARMFVDVRAIKVPAFTA